MPGEGSGVELTRLQVRMIRSMFAQDIAPRPHLSLACKSNPKGVVALAGSNRRQCRRRLRECSVAVIVINACQASRIDQTGVAGQNQVKRPVIIVVSPGCSTVLQVGQSRAADVRERIVPVVVIKRRKRSVSRKSGDNQVGQPVIIIISPRDRNALNALQPGVDVSEDRGSPVWSTATAVDPGDVLNSIETCQNQV